MSKIGDQAVLISRNITELLSAQHYYGQLLLQDESKKQECINTMLGCAFRIEKSAKIIAEEVRHTRDLFNA